MAALRQCARISRVRAPSGNALTGQAATTALERLGVTSYAGGPDTARSGQLRQPV